MPRHIAALCVAVGLLLGRPPRTHGQSAPRLDIHGDPLPPRALLRLGKVERLRHPGEVRALALSPDGKILASAGVGGTVCLWALPSGKELHVLTGHEEAVQCLAFSPDGKLLASAGDDRAIHVWDVASGKLLQRLLNVSGTPRALAFSPDGRLLASGGNYSIRALRVWDLRTGVETGPSFFEHDPVSAVAFSSDGKTVLSGTETGTLLLWETDTGKLLRRLPVNQNRLIAARFSPDGKTILTASSPGYLSLWEVDTGKLVRQTRAHKARLHSTAVSADGSRVATAGPDGVRVWDRATGNQVSHYPLTEDDSSAAVALSGDGKILGAANVGGRLRCWEVSAPRAVSPGAEQTPVRAVAMSPDGRMAATLAHDAVRLWDARNGKLLRVLSSEGEGFRCVAFAPAGKQVATYGLLQGDEKFRGRYRLWDAHTGEALWVSPPSGDQIQRLEFTPDGKTLIGLGAFRDVSLREAATGKELRRLHVELSAVCTLALAPDGRLLASAPLRGPAQLWDLTSGLKIGQVGDPSGRLQALAFTPDGRGLATVRHDGEVRLWEVATRRVRLRLPGVPSGPTFSRGAPVLAFAPDGRALAVSRADYSVRLWDNAAGKELGELRGHRDVIADLAFAPHGRALLSGSWDTTALVWGISDWQASRRAGKPLSPAEAERAWQSLGGSEPASVHRPLWDLVGAPAQTVKLFRQRLRPVRSSGRSVEQIIADLDSPRYAARQKATAELTRLGERVRPALMNALAKKPSLESQRRIDALLHKLGSALPSGEDLRALRALEVLERIGTPEARALVAELARGDGAALLTVEARATLERLERRPTAGR